MPINPIRHFALTAWPTVHDVEAMSSLALMGRQGAKVNEVIESVNRSEITVNEAIESIHDEIVATFEQAMKDGSLSRVVGEQALRDLKASLDDLDKRIDDLIMDSTTTEDNPELIDARNGYTTLGAAIRNLMTGDAFKDAIRPGTIEAGRIFPGMLGGELGTHTAARYTVPMAGHWTGGNAYYNEGKERIEHTGYTMSDMLPCKYGDAFEITSYLFGPLVRPAVVFNSSGVCIQVLGNPGNSDWQANRHTVIVSDPQAAYISFVCGAGYLQDFRCVSIKTAQAAQPITGGYWRIHAKNRTNTVLDRAQIRCSFPCKPGSDVTHKIPVQILKAENVKGVTIRVFAALSDKSYELQLPETAAGYSFDPGDNIMPYFDQIATQTGEGEPYTHVCLFVDFIAEDPTKYMDAWILPPVMDETVPAINPAVHGGLPTDTLSIVAPAAAFSPAYGKTILGMGDSLMSGNTLTQDKSWFSLAAGNLGMTYDNKGLNGSPVAPSTDASAPQSMRERIGSALAAMPAPDYFILTGGANDKRLNVSIDAFREALVYIIQAVKASNPACKILLGTNWRRTTNANSLGLHDSDYVAAMIQVAEEQGVNSFNNYAHGLNLLDPTIAAWADEGLVSTGEANIHFSEAANRHIADKYRQIITGL